MIRRFSPLILGLQFLIDVLLTLAAVKTAELIRLHVTTGLERREGRVQNFVVEPWVYVLICIIWVCFFILFGPLETRRRDSTMLDIGKLWLSITVSMLVLASTFYLLALQPPVAPSRLFYLYFYALDIVGLAVVHLAFSRVLTVARRKGHDLRRVLLIGTGVQARHVAVRLQGEERTGLSLLGYLGDAEDESMGEFRRYGNVSDLLRVVRDQEVDEVVVALPASAHAEILRLNSELADTDVSVRILPDVFEMVAMRARVEDFYGLPLISLREASMNPVQARVKRAFDIVLASLVILVTLPAMLVIAVWVRLDSPGPALVHQRRVGAGGNVFRMHKFRSMTWNPDDLESTAIKSRHDPRVTRVGRVLRRTSLDELPQLWNVFIGEMSLVGPRPELPGIVEQYEPWQRKRFNVPPGMTGWWQVNGRADRSMHLNTEVDLFYVQNYSILLDVQILLRTLKVVIKGDGAF